MLQNTKSKFARPIALALCLAALAGCEREQAQVTSEAEIPDADLPQGEVARFEGFTLRANALPSEALPPAMAREHGIEAAADLGLLNVVVLEHLPDGQDVPVSAEVSAQHEDPAGFTTDIDMRATKADGDVAYIGTFAIEPQDEFHFTVEARPASGGKTYTMDFDARFGPRE